MDECILYILEFCIKKFLCKMIQLLFISLNMVGLMDMGNPFSRL